MKKILFFIIGGLLFLSACSDSSKNKEAAFYCTDTISPKMVEAIAVKDTFNIMEPSIIFTNPSDIEANKMMAKDSDAFNTIVDDNAFYNSQIMELADSLAIKTNSTSFAVLDFKTTNNRHFIINRLKLKDMEFSNYLFNGVDTPQIVNMECDRAFLKKYFNK